MNKNISSINKIIEQRSIYYYLLVLIRYCFVENVYNFPGLCSYVWTSYKTAILNELKLRSKKYSSKIDNVDNSSCYKNTR